MSKDEAIAKAEAYVKTKETTAGLELVLLREATVERDFGWVFFYDSRAYAAEGDISSALAGNAPFIFRRRDGAIIETGTAEPLDTYLSRLLAGGAL